MREGLTKYLRKKKGLVAHTGFEPVISSLRGTRPRPLDECAAWLFWLASQDSNLGKRLQRPLCYHYTTRQGLLVRL